MHASNSLTLFHSTEILREFNSIDLQLLPPSPPLPFRSVGTVTRPVFRDKILIRTPKVRSPWRRLGPSSSMGFILGCKIGEKRICRLADQCDVLTNQPQANQWITLVQVDAFRDRNHSNNCDWMPVEKCFGCFWLCEVHVIAMVYYEAPQNPTQTLRR